MSKRAAFSAAMAEERDIAGWAIPYILDDLECGTETVSEDRDVIAHYLWAHEVTPDHLEECRADDEHSIYENECAPCKELLLAIADRVLSRVVLADPAQPPWVKGCFGHCDPEGWAPCRKPSAQESR